MRVPVYEELKISKFDVMTVLDQMKKSRVGQVPSYIDLIELPRQELEQAVQAIQDALDMLRLSPLFPYPIFVITQEIGIDSKLPIVEDKAKLPKHFMRPIKRLTSKELSLLNKAVTLTERITNTPIKQRQRELHEGTRFHKTLFQLTKELDFYQDILESLQTRKRG